MQGFIIFDDYGSQYPEFYQQMSEWLKDGKIKYKEHMAQVSELITQRLRLTLQ